MVSAHRYVRIFLCGRSKQALEHIPFHHVVRIHKADILSHSRFHAAVPRHGNTAVFLVNYPDAAVPVPPFAQYLRRMVGRTVIDANDFDIFHALTGQAFHTLVQIGGNIITGNNDGNGYAHGGSILFYPD